MDDGLSLMTRMVILKNRHMVQNRGGVKRIDPGSGCGHFLKEAPV